MVSHSPSAGDRVTALLTLRPVCRCGLCCSTDLQQVRVSGIRTLLTSPLRTPVLYSDVTRSYMKLHRKSEGCSFSLPVNKCEARNTYLTTRSSCSTVAGQAAIWHGEFTSAALVVPSAAPESRAGSSNLSCKSHFRHTRRRRSV